MSTNPIYDGWPWVQKIDDGYNFIIRIIPLKYLTRTYANAGCNPDFPGSAVMLARVVLFLTGLFYVFEIISPGVLSYMPLYPLYANMPAFILYLVAILVYFFRVDLFGRLFVKKLSFTFADGTLSVEDHNGNVKRFDLTVPHSFEQTRHSKAYREKMHHDNTLTAYQESSEIFYISQAKGIRRKVCEICGALAASKLFSRIRQIDQLVTSNEQEPTAYNEEQEIFYKKHEEEIEQALMLFNLSDDFECTSLSRRFAKLARITHPQNHGSQALFDQVNNAYALLKRLQNCS